MPAAESYSVTEALSHGGRAILYRGVRTSDGHRVILKVLDPQLSRAQDAKGLEREYELATLFESPALVRPLALATYAGMPALVMEDSGATSLDRLLGPPMPVERALFLASGIAAALAELHAKDVVHQDVKPANILVEESGEVKLTDFGMALRMPRGRARPQGLSRIEGSLPYLSPEQTGRMNRSVDARSDLYALGVTLYQMLTGRLPFEANDPLEWVHCHVAHTPRAPRELVPEIPTVVSDIVLKLLEKLAERRYQTARGLQHDLEAALTALRADGRIPSFPLGQHDRSDRFEISEKLYGRREEVAALSGAFERVAVSKRPELVLVAGYSGIGKSALVREIHQPIARARGLFISGKLDQYKRDIPYSTFAQAFADLVEQILTQSEERLSAWRTELRSALGASGQLIVDIIPRLELIIGPQAPVAALPPLEAQNRFQRVFRQFVGVFARKEHPLVVFLDDLQWLDSGSFTLVTDLLAHEGYLLLLGAYRNNEVGPSHPLALGLAGLRRANAAVHEIALGPLDVEDLRQLVADTLHSTTSAVAPLAALVHEKTAGNPFFAIQFLTTLYQEGLVELDRSVGQWRWDIEKIHAKGFTDNVLDLMARKVNRLPVETREVLKAAACVGNSSDLATLALVSGRAEEDTARVLQEAVFEGLLLQTGSHYAFVHDRIQQALYRMIEREDARAVHLHIGRILSRSLDPQQLEERIFDVVTQLNLGSDLILDPAEREELARLDLVAGRKAKAAIAYVPARGFLAAGAALLPADAWDSRYELAFAISMELAEAEYLCGAFDEAKARFDVLLSHARTALDKAAVYGRRMQLSQVASRFEEAADLGIAALSLLGVAVPETDEAFDRAIEAEVAWVRARIGERPIPELASVPEASDPVGRGLIALLANMAAPAYIVRPRLMPFVILKLVRCALEFGPTQELSFGYTAFAMLLVSMFDAVEPANEIAEMATELGRRLGDIRWRGAALFVRGTFVDVWLHPFAASAKVLEAGFRACIDAGDLAFAGYAAGMLTWQAVERGDSLEDVGALAKRLQSFTSETRNDASDQLQQLIEHFAACLMGRTRGRTSLDDGSFEEARSAATICRAKYTPAIVHYHVIKILLAYLAGEDALALRHVSEARSMLAAITAMPLETTYVYLHALVLARGHASAGPEERPMIVEALAAHERRLAVWASGCPENFRTKHALVAAEIARIEGDELTAERRYDEAVQAARASGFAHWQAIACELAASFHRARGLPTLADAYVRDAVQCYARWGAETKVRALEVGHPDIRRPSEAPTATFAGRVEQLDFLSVAKALRKISGVMVQRELIQTLLDVVLEEGGARRALLVFLDAGSPRIEAEADVDPTPRNGSVESRVPLSVVHYVHRTDERIVLDEHAIAFRFGHDPYFERVRPKSVLCLPVRHRGEVVALLYLENELVPGAFTPERLLALDLLAAQAAISLENARLLREMQQALRVREEFTLLASHELRTPLTSMRMLVEALVDARARGNVLREEVLDRSYRRILGGVGRLEQLAGALLDASMIERGDLELRPTSLDLRSLVEDAVKNAEHEVRAARCSVAIESTGPVIGMWDRSRMEKVVASLLSNALKFGAGKPIEIRVAEVAGTAQLVVEDHGSGIDPSHLGRLFERFERGVSLQHFGGFGLGLYVTRRVIEAHGGTIRVESTPGVGSRFIVELPCRTSIGAAH